MKYDFGGWATRNDLTCTDGRVIKKDAFKGHKFENLILMALGTGLRQGELLALKWENVNLVEKYLEVKESVKKVYVFDNDGNKKLETIYNTPKTQNSIRRVDLPDKLPNKPAVPCIISEILSGVILAPNAHARAFFPFFFIILVNIYMLY